MDKPVSLEQGILKLLSVLNEQSFERMDNSKKINGKQGTKIPNTCEQETTSPEENMASCIKSLANEKEEIEYLEKISANVYAQEANGFK